MAYSDYGAFVYCNGERRRDKEDNALFSTDEETFGTDSANIGSGARIFAALLKAKADGRPLTVATHIAHGVMGDGPIRVRCYKQGRPQIFELLEDGSIEEVKQRDKRDDEDWLDYEYGYGTERFEYKGYSFVWESGRPNEAEMIEPDGTRWLCEYDYGYGAGFEDE